MVSDNNSTWWKDYPWREIQTNLREIDMMDIDAKRYVEELKKFNATVTMINTSGIISSYKTSLPFHYQSLYLKGDSLEKIIEECHRAGIKVLARTDFSKIRKEIYENHPEWAYISPKGKTVDYNGDVHVCISGDYQQKYALEIVKETIEKLDVDGIFFNMGGFQVRDYSGNYYGICHCESCKKKFYEMFNTDLPEKEDMDDSKYLKYLLFKDKVTYDYNKKVYDFIYNINPNIIISIYIENRGFAENESNTAMDRPLPHWQYSASDNTKRVVTSYPDMISSNKAVDFIDIPYRHVAVSPDQQRLRLIQNLANGGGLGYYLMGRLDNTYDQSSFEPVKEIYKYHSEHENEYKNLVSSAEVALINGEYGNNQEYRGWFRFLTEGHYFFDSLNIERAFNVNWNKYKAMIIPDYKALSCDLIEKADEFVKNGGTLISIALSGFQDENFKQRQLPAFKCMGIENINVVRSDMRAAYFCVPADSNFKHFQNKSLVYFDKKYIYADYNKNVEKHFNLMPPQKFGPPERCYYTITTDYPAFTVNSYGSGKGIFIPWNPGELFYRQGYTNTFDFIKDLLNKTCGLTSVEGNLSPMIETTLLESKDGNYSLLHLVNGSGHFGVTFYAPVKINGINVTLNYPGNPVHVTSLVTGKKYSFTTDKNNLNIELPFLDAFDAIKIDNKAE